VRPNLLYLWRTTPASFLLGLVFNTTGMLVNSLVSLAASSVRTLIRETDAASRAMHRVAGVVLIVLGPHFALASHQ